MYRLKKIWNDCRRRGLLQISSGMDFDYQYRGEVLGKLYILVEDFTYRLEQAGRIEQNGVHRHALFIKKEALRHILLQTQSEIITLKSQVLRQGLLDIENFEIFIDTLSRLVQPIPNLDNVEGYPNLIAVMNLGVEYNEHSCIYMIYHKMHVSSEQYLHITQAMRRHFAARTTRKEKPGLSTKYSMPS